MDKKFYRSDESFAIIGAAMEVFNVIGCGLKEKVYQDALKVEFELRNIPMVKEFNIPINYKGVILRHDYFADFVCYEDIIVEVKSVPQIQDEHRAQLLTYMRLNKSKLGLLLNFGNTSLQFERKVL